MISDITESFSKLLWFIYRMIFVLIPSAFVLICIFVFILFFKDKSDELSFIYNKASIFQDNLTHFEKSSIVFIIIFVLYLSIDAIATVFIRIFLNFHKFTDEYFTKKSAYNSFFIKKMNKRLQKKFKYYDDDFITKPIHTIDNILFVFTERYTNYNTHLRNVWTYENFYSHLFISFVIINLAFVPIGISLILGNIWWYPVFLFAEIASISGIVLLIKKIGFRNYHENYSRPVDIKKKEKNKYVQLITDSFHKKTGQYIGWSIIIAILFIGCSILLFTPGRYLMLFAGNQLLLFPFLYSFFSRALRYYIQVEEITLNGWINMHYGKELFPQTDFLK